MNLWEDVEKEYLERTRNQNNSKFDNVMKVYSKKLTD